MLVQVKNIYDCKQEGDPQAYAHVKFHLDNMFKYLRRELDDQDKERAAARRDAQLHHPRRRASTQGQGQGQGQGQEQGQGQGQGQGRRGGEDQQHQHQHQLEEEEDASSSWEDVDYRPNDNAFDEEDNEDDTTTSPASLPSSKEEEEEVDQDLLVRTMGPCLEHLLQNRVPETLVQWAMGDQPFGIRQLVLVFFIRLIKAVKVPLLLPEAVVRVPLERLLRSCGQAVDKHDPANSSTLMSWMELCLLVVSKVVRAPGLLPLFFVGPTSDRERTVTAGLGTSSDTRFPIVGCMLEALDLEDSIGRLARQGLLLVVELVKKEPLLAEYLVKDALLGQQIAVKLAEHYVVLPSFLIGSFAIGKSAGAGIVHGGTPRKTSSSSSSSSSVNSAAVSPKPPAKSPRLAPTASSGSVGSNGDNAAAATPTTPSRGPSTPRSPASPAPPASPPALDDPGWLWWRFVEFLQFADRIVTFASPHQLALDIAAALEQKLISTVIRDAILQPAERAAATGTWYTAYAMRELESPLLIAAFERLLLDPAVQGELVRRIDGMSNALAVASLSLWDTALGQFDPQFVEAVALLPVDEDQGDKALLSPSVPHGSTTLEDVHETVSKWLSLVAWPEDSTIEDGDVVETQDDYLEDAQEVREQYQIKLGGWHTHRVTFMTDSVPR